MRSLADGKPKPRAFLLQNRAASIAAAEGHRRESVVVAVVPFVAKRLPLLAWDHHWPSKEEEEEGTHGASTNCPQCICILQN